MTPGRNRRVTREKSSRSLLPQSLNLLEITTVLAFSGRTLTSYNRGRRCRHRHSAFQINEERERNQMREKGKRK
ncbi:hypothetical protein TIFTF001_007195 [Ficus carica]|uniref:Uncharacterized protein n=1 Tax=Ficus carica TaxID=3494 RepID=A0AA88DGB3_FICCA|nr:hypothetical protein TIFTF001_007195 [Ficus carica]